MLLNLDFKLILIYKKRGYWFKNWNKFDFFIVIISIIDVILDLNGKIYYFLFKLKYNTLA